MITTLTLNPAYDVHAKISQFKLSCENLADEVTRDVGGKGINISNALCANGVDNTALVLLGSENSADFKAGLLRAGIKYTAFECPGRIRENITIHPQTGKETRLSFKGFECNADVLDKMLALIDANGIVTFTGSLPQGIDEDSAESFLIELKRRGAKLVIDSKSVTLPMLYRIKPWLIKPNEEEIETYFGKVSDDKLVDCALELNARGIENVMISLGGDGAILANGGKTYRARVPKIEVRSTIGAGDSSVAGFIACDGNAEFRLKNAMAYGAAACMREGTNPPRKKDIESILNKIKIDEYN